jgi:hypothetical protein
MIPIFGTWTVLADGKMPSLGKTADRVAFLDSCVFATRRQKSPTDVGVRFVHVQRRESAGIFWRKKVKTRRGPIAHRSSSLTQRSYPPCNIPPSKDGAKEEQAHIFIKTHQNGQSVKWEIKRSQSEGSNVPLVIGQSLRIFQWPPSAP